MPTVIPYDPSLALGNIVDEATLNNLIEIGKAQAPVDAAQDTMNSFISMKRSIDMTIQELIDMKIDTSDLAKNSQDVGKEISDAAIAYAKIKMTQEKVIQGLKANSNIIHKSLESPIDYNRTQIKPMPLSADSLKMDSQYFSFDSNSQDADNSMSSIKGFVDASVSRLGTKVSADVSTSVQSQISSQRENHDIDGTLIISAVCTHKQASLLAPFILDVDKAIRVWNGLCKNSQGGLTTQDLIKINDPSSMAKILAEEGTDKEKAFQIISGATFGSCFVGMVHVKNTKKTNSSQNITSRATDAEASFKVAAVVSDWSGGFGLDNTMSNDIKKLLSTQEVQSHINVVTMGLIPSLKSNALITGVKSFTNFDAKNMGEQLAALQNATATDRDTVDSSATAAQTGGKLMAMQSTKIASVMTGLAEVDQQSNQILNINSMMTAFDDYMVLARAGEIGVPINYYLKSITRAQLAEMWVAKYFPEYLKISSGDDSAPTADAKSA